jgi:hypothetical protein
MDIEPFQRNGTRTPKPASSSSKQKPDNLNNLPHQQEILTIILQP